MAAPAGVDEDRFLYITNDKFFIESLTAPQVILVIDRITYEITLEPNNGQIPMFAIKKPIAGLIGSITLIAGPYLMVVTRKAHVGLVCGGDIWSVAETEIISYARAEHHLTPSEVAENNRYIDLLKEVLSTPYFYFSYNTDLSHTRQREAYLRSEDGDPEFTQKSLLERCNETFVWNLFALGPIRQHPSKRQVQPFIVLLIHGHVSVEEFRAGRRLKVSHVARRSTERPGTRLNVRGVDKLGLGYVANFVETEQLVEVDGNVASFVQIRGSIPLLWSQRPNLLPNPPPVLDHQADHTPGLTNHFTSLVQRYGFCVAVSLIAHQRSEGALAAELQARLPVDRVHLEPFDFHRECKEGWDRLTTVLDRLDQYQVQFGFFLQSRNQAKRTTLKKQSGVLRTNCIDCLDRTNAVQFLISRKNLQIMLEGLGLPGVMDIKENDQKFRRAWVSHGNQLSRQHSGAEATYTDLTLTDSISTRGWMEDGRRSTVRYIKNNFFDGARQDALDVFVGNHRVGANNTRLTGKWWRKMVTWCIAFAIFLIGIAIAFAFFPEVLPLWVPITTLFGGIGVFVGALFVLVGPNMPELCTDLH